MPWSIIVTHAAGLDTENFEADYRSLGTKGNASQEVLLLRGWLNSWPMRSDVSQTVSVSSFLLSSWLPLEGSSVNDFPLQNFATTGPDLQKATQLVVRAASITQDIAAV
jgi:hypothetical protein